MYGFLQNKTDVTPSHQDENHQAVSHGYLVLFIKTQSKNDQLTKYQKQLIYTVVTALHKQ